MVLILNVYVKIFEQNFMLILIVLKLTTQCTIRVQIQTFFVTIRKNFTNMVKYKGDRYLH